MSELVSECCKYVCCVYGECAWCFYGECERVRVCGMCLCVSINGMGVRVCFQRFAYFCGRLA